MTPHAETVFVPAHITGFFATKPADDPLVAGSVGAGLTLTDGVSVTVREGGDELIVDGTARSVAPVDRIVDALAGDVTVCVQNDVPIGAGFGVSGAIALGVAFGVNAVTRGGRSENDLIRLAHRAEVEAGTGLGDVVAQARGGAPIRVEAGAPGYGRLDGIPERRRVEYLSFGELSTSAVLAGDTSAINAAGTAALERLRADPTLETFMAVSRRFAREAKLLEGRVLEVVEAVEANGGIASMAMLGQTVFALDYDLTDAGFDAQATAISDGSIAFE